MAISPVRHQVFIKKPKTTTNGKKTVTKVETIENLILTDTEIKDSKGNIERHDIVEETEDCDPAAGDYMPDDSECMICSGKLLCIINAIVFGRMERSAVPTSDMDAIDVCLANDDRLKVDNKIVSTNDRGNKGLSPVKKIKRK